MGTIVIRQGAMPSHGYDKLGYKQPSSGRDVSGSPIGWWLADEIAGLSDDDPVGTWPDQSGNGLDLTQATAGSKPTYKTSIQNGKPAVLFDDTDDYLEVATSQYDQPNTYFLVCNHAATGGDGMVIDGKTARNVFYKTGGKFSSYAGTVVNLGTIDTSMHVWSLLFYGASSWGREDGSEVNTDNPGTAALDDLYVGGESSLTAGWFFGGYLCELVIYDGSESPTVNESYLNGKYAVY